MSKKIRTKEVWLSSLESIAADASKDPHARLSALRQIGEMMGFRKSHNYDKLSSEERLEMVQKVVAPVLNGVFGIEVEFEEEKDFSIRPDES
tara:strand:+ start:2086 stop:2361 length:276 start_codon:yes stop_codon:yes gene_type:complete